MSPELSGIAGIGVPGIGVPGIVSPELEPLEKYRRANRPADGFRAAQPYFFSRYPLLKIQAMAVRQMAMIASITATLDQTGTSAMPKNVQRKPLTR